MQKILTLFSCVLLFSGCAKWEIPLEKKLKICQKPTGIIAVADANDPKKYTFTITGNTAETSLVSWKQGTVVIGSTTVGMNLGANSPNPSLTVGSFVDGTFSISADVTTQCGDKVTFNTSITINTVATVASSFSLTDPMVHENLQAIAVANDGTVIANDISVIKIWDYKNRTLLRTLTGHNGTVSDLVLSTDEKYLFSSSNSPKDNIIVYDWKTGVEVRRLSGHTNGVYSLAISADNKYLVSGSGDNTIKIWNVADGTLIRTINVGYSVNDVSVSNDAQYVVAKYYNNGTFFKVWNGQTGSEYWSIPYSNMNYAVINPNGTQLWISYNNNGPSLDVWNIATKQLVKTYNNSGYGLSMSQDGKYVYTGYMLIDALTNNIIYQYKTPFAGFYPDRSTISANNQYGSTLNAGNIALCPLITGDKIDNNTIKHSSIVLRAYLSKDGKSLISHDYSSARVWDLQTGTERNIIKPTTSNIFYNVGVMNSSIWIKSCGLEQYSIGSGTLIKPYININDCADAIAISQDEKYMVIQSQNNILSLRDASTGTEIRSIPSGHYSRYLSFTPDNKNIISVGYDKIVKIWDVATGNLLRTITSTLQQIDGSVLSADGTLIAMSYFGKVEVYNVATGALINSINLSSGNTYSLAFSPDTKNLAISGSSSIKIYNISSGAVIKTKTFNYGVKALAFNATGTILYVTTSKDFQVLNLQ